MRVRLGVRKRSFTRGSTATGSPGHGPQLPEFEEHLRTLTQSLNLGGLVWSLELDLISVGPFQLGYPMIL